MFGVLNGDWVLNGMPHGVGKPRGFCARPFVRRSAAATTAKDKRVIADDSHCAGLAVLVRAGEGRV